MSKRYYKLQENPALALPEATTSLPFDRPVAVYYRQSTEHQVGNISTAIQTIDMVADLKRRGWPEDKIILIDMDKGVSGTTKIDEREGMSNLFALITEGKIGAAACQDEDRLFRDVTQIQVNIFIEACKVSRVLVLTPSMIYDFANELTGAFHARQFRFKCEMAAEYINTVIKGKLQKAKRRMLLEGRWGGAGIPPGFMIDMRKTLPDGSTNENWRKFFPFEPYAEIVREYFRLFLSFNGHLRTTVRHIQDHGPWYPDPATCKPPDGFRFVYRMFRHSKGYCPGRVGLGQLLTNAAYIGHWAFNGTIVQWNNHPAIVSVDVFMQAYNYLSAVTMNGQPNLEYRPLSEHARPSCEEGRPEERPLCSGMIFSEYAGRWRGVGTHWQPTLKHYTYEFRGNSNTVNEYIWGRVSRYFDDAVARLLHDKFVATFDSPVWEESLASFRENLDNERKRRQAQLDMLSR
ncbi:MAG: recombinase family protein, partial [Anaerolineae bacterium]|nr:recombinase family protein [Anaerolineae bacterium]